MRRLLFENKIHAQGFIQDFFVWWVAGNVLEYNFHVYLI